MIKDCLTTIIILQQPIHLMKKVIIIVSAFLLIIILIALFIAPPLAKSYVVKNSPELIGRQIKLEKLSLNYFTMSVSLQDFILYEEDTETPFISFSTFDVNLQPWYLFRSELVIQELMIDGLKVHIVQHDSTFNFDSIINFLLSDDSEEIEPLITDSVESEPFKFHLSNMELKNGEFLFTDAVIGQDINMEDLNLFVPYIGWNQEDASDAGLKFYFTNGGFFQSTFQMDPVTGIFNTTVTINELDLSTFYGYAKQQLYIDTLQGSLNTTLRAKGNTNNLDTLVIDGWVGLSALNITSNGGQKLVSVDSLYCKIGEIKPLMSRYLIDTFKIIQPSISISLYDSTNNIFALFKDEDEPSETHDSTKIINDTVSEENSYPLYYSLNNFRIENGSLSFMDHTYKETFTYQLSSMEMNVDSITSDAVWIDATSTMILNNRGNLQAEIGIDPSNPMELDLQIAISEFHLSDLNIYTNHYVGHDIVFGNLYYMSDTKIRSGQIISKNKLTIRDIEINNIKGGIQTLPLKLALFILKDKNGDAFLDIPVSGDLNDPTLTIGKLVWSSFKNMIVKIVSAPYHFLAGIVSADPSELKSIKYDFTDTILTPKKQRQLDLLLELEQKKEELDIHLVYFTDMKLEKEEIAIADAGKSFMKKTNMDYRNNKSEFMEYLHNNTKNDTLNLAEAAIILSNSIYLDSSARLLSDYRFQSIKSYLYHQNDSSTIRISKYEPDAPKNIGSKPYFEVEYALKNNK